MLPTLIQRYNKNPFIFDAVKNESVVVRWCEGVVYLRSPGRGVQLILAYRWARPAIPVAGKGRGGMFLLFLLFLHFHSFSSFFPVPPTRVDVLLNPNTIKMRD